MRLFDALVVVLFFSVCVFADAFMYPLPKDIAYDEQKADLGKLLFYEPMISRNGKTPCASCHTLYEKRDALMPAPTMLNASLNYRHLWRGDLSVQSIGINEPEHNKDKLLLDDVLLIQKLQKSPIYNQKFKVIFGDDAITMQRFIEVLLEFEKALITHDSKFDRYLRGEDELSKNEAQGYELFRSYGCVTCHNGVNIGGNSKQVMGMVVPMQDCSDMPISEAIKYRVPTLRNITITAPYYHDGSVETLFEAIKVVGKHNLGVDIDAKDIDFIIEFLETLTGKKPEILND
jgi:cytochrome c peroxidase